MKWQSVFFINFLSLISKSSLLGATIVGVIVEDVDVGGAGIGGLVLGFSDFFHIIMLNVAAISTKMLNITTSRF